MGTLKSKCMAVLAAALFTGSVWAASSPTPVEQYLIQSGSKITQRFASASGLTAIVADNGKEQRMFYVTPDGKNLILGAIFDATGKNLTSQDMAKLASANQSPEAPSAVNPVGLLERASKSAWIADGSRGKVVYAIFDPNCMYCHELHSSLRGAVAAGKVQVRWIPVSILSQSGSNTIAAIYAAQDRAEALQSAFNRILPGTQVSPAANVAIARNVLLLRDTGYSGVPVVLFEQNGKVILNKGVPSPQTMATITGS